MDQTTHQNDAVTAIKKLSDAIERRREAEAEVGKAQRDLSAIAAKNATSGESLNSVLRDFSAIAMHW